MLGMLQIAIYGLGGVMALLGLLAWLLDAKLSRLAEGRRRPVAGPIICLIAFLGALGLSRWADRQAAEVERRVTETLRGGMEPQAAPSVSDWRSVEQALRQAGLTVPQMARAAGSGRVLREVLTQMSQDEIQTFLTEYKRLVGLGTTESDAFALALAAVRPEALKTLWSQR
jgi:hypothetical protein